MGNTGCHGFGVFDKAVSSWLNNEFEVHGLTEDGYFVVLRRRLCRRVYLLKDRPLLRIVISDSQ